MYTNTKPHVHTCVHARVCNVVNRADFHRRNRIVTTVFRDVKRRGIDLTILCDAGRVRNEQKIKIKNKKQNVDAIEEKL